MNAIIGRRCQGASHKRNNKECQDQLKSRCDFKDGTVILAVADGHGSNTCPYSSDGAKQAVQAFITVLSDLYSNYKDNLQLLMTYLNREGDTKVAFDICQAWQEKVLSTHQQYKRSVPLNAEGDHDNTAIWKMYGSTLLGMIVTNEFLFAFQIGDGDIAFVDKNGFSKVIEGDKILGVETHSLSKIDAWQRAYTMVRPWSLSENLPSAFILTTDGFSNSFKTDSGYEKTCIDYYNMLNDYGPVAIKNNLKTWLYETSEGGCGDDISMMILYNYPDDAIFKPVPGDDCDE